MAFGPVPSGPDTLAGAVLLIGFGVVGFISLLLNVVAKSKGRETKWPVILFLVIVLLFFIVGGLVELSRIR